MAHVFPSQKLLDWFQKKQRKLPWRVNYSPYEVWISEVMAQQTQISTLLPYYEKFISKFPTVKELASADYEEVLKAWEGLGYYSRAKNLHTAAKEVMENYGGKIPETKEELQKLKGFGPYISSAVASIAFQEAVPVVDGNVLRVVARFFGLKDDISTIQTRKSFEKILEEVIPKKEARNFNQGLMELGALICTPKNPNCEKCPLMKKCVAFELKMQESLPVKTKKAKPPVKHFAAVAITNSSGYLLQKRHSKLLEGMYEFPMYEILPLKNSKENMEDLFSTHLNTKVNIGSEIGQVEHQYTHFKQIVHVYSAKIASENSFQYFSTKQVEKIPLSKVQHKIFQKILK